MPGRHRAATAVAVLALVGLAGCTGSSDAADPPPAPRTQTFTYDHASDGSALEVDVTVPPDAGGDAPPLMVLIHGGGFHSGARTEYRTAARKLADRGWAVAAIDYELGDVDASDSGAAALAGLERALDDSRSAISWLTARSDDLGFDPDQVVAFGESAGGTTATGLAYLGDEAPAVRAAASASGRSDTKLFDEFSTGDHPVLFLTWDEDPADDVAIERATCAAAKRVEVVCKNLVLHGDQHGADPAEHIDDLEAFFAETAGIRPVAS